MWLEWIEITVSAGEWTKVDALISQAQRSIVEAEEAEEVALNSNRRPNADNSHVDPHSKVNRVLIGTCQVRFFVQAIFPDWLSRLASKAQTVCLLLQNSGKNRRALWRVSSEEPGVQGRAREAGQGRCGPDGNQLALLQLRYCCLHNPLRPRLPGQV